MRSEEIELLERGVPSRPGQADGGGDGAVQGAEILGGELVAGPHLDVVVDLGRS